MLKRCRQILTLTLFILLLPVFAFAQTASELDFMLQADTVTAAKAARFVLGAADLLPAGISGAEAGTSTERASASEGSPLEKTAYDMASQKDWIKVSSGEAVTMKDTAFLIMKAFDLKGGVMYRMFKNPRYAYREMVYQKLIPGHSDQKMKVSGAKLLLILDRVMRNEE